MFTYGNLVLFSLTDGLQPQDIFGLDHQSREGYIKMMCRLISNSLSEARSIDSGSVMADVQGLGSW
jgi:nuclear pore complex protein Nup205